MESDVEKFIDNRPNVIAAYGYGSGIVNQMGYENKDKMIKDLILVVDDIKKWHEENIKENPKDYTKTGRKFFLDEDISKIKGLTGIAYLNHIKEDKQNYKYGTIEYDDLVDYLNTWESFYVPGRLQKNVLNIKSNEELDRLIKINRLKGLYVALLTLKDMNNSKLIDVYAQICRLSYLGDIKMKFAENPNKIINITLGSYNELKEIYGEESIYFDIYYNGYIDIKKDRLLTDLETLPYYLYNYLDKDYNINKQSLEIIRRKIIEYFTMINRKESIDQGFKSLNTNGVINTISYASSKVLKRIKH